MSTPIILALNGVTVDYGASFSWNNHRWLFPPNSLAEIPHHYAGGFVQTKVGYATTVDEARFRMSHLGYSTDEAARRFDSAARRWNRTYELALTHEAFRGELSVLTFKDLTSSDMEPYIWDFRRYVLSILAPWDTPDAGLEDFICGLDYPLLLLAVTQHPENASLPIHWQCKDFVDAGWTAFEDLDEPENSTLITWHNLLSARLNARAGNLAPGKFDDWLVEQGVARDRAYVKTHPGGKIEVQQLTLPVAIRHMIHHPENTQNILSDQDLEASVESMLDLARRVLPSSR